MKKPVPLLKQTQAELAAAPEYRAAPPLRDPGVVGPATDLGALNLNWTERDLPERVRTKHVHRLHPYFGKYVPQLVEIFLRKFRPRRVLDPFVGSGTTLVEANVLGVEGIGIDISAFNCLLARVKTSAWDADVAEREARDALARVMAGTAAARDEPGAYLRDWYDPRALLPLLAFRDIVDDYASADLLRIILSRAARSARLARHDDLEHPKAPQREPYRCHKHRRLCAPTTDAIGFLRRYTSDTVRRVREFAALRTPAPVHVWHGDARTISLPTVDMIMTSPPYVGLIDYHEQHRYAYELLGLPSRDAEEIGAHARGRARAAREAYVAEIGAALARAGRHLAPDGVAVIVVGDRQRLYDGLAERLGFREEGRLRRHVNRRTGRRSSDFFEDVMVWRRA